MDYTSAISALQKIVNDGDAAKRAIDALSLAGRAQAEAVRSQALTAAAQAELEKARQEEAAITARRAAERAAAEQRAREQSASAEAESAKRRAEADKALAAVQERLVARKLELHEFEVAALERLNGILAKVAAEEARYEELRTKLAELKARL